MTEPRPTPESELIEQIRAIDVRAPESLHRQIDSMIADAGKRPRARARARTGARRDRPARSARSFRLAPRLAAGGAIAAVIVVLAIAIGLSGGGSSALSVRDASALTLRQATAPAPGESPSDRRQLTASVEGVRFPYWGGHFGWRSTGSRTDTVDGRAVTTVFYTNRRGERVGYAIVAGDGRAQMSGGVVSMRDGTPYRVLTVDGVAVVTWLRDGRLCVVSGRGVSGSTLLTLASWDDHHTVAS